MPHSLEECILPSKSQMFEPVDKPPKSVMHGQCGTVHEPYRNRSTDRDAVWVVDSGGPKETYSRWRSRSPVAGGNFERKCRSPLKIIGSCAKNSPDAVSYVDSGSKEAR